MRIVFGVLTVAAMLAAAAAPVARAQAPAGLTYVVTYLEILPAKKAEAIGLLKQIAATSRKEAGSQRYDVVERIERDNQFAILEAWSDLKAAEAHLGGDAMKQFRDKLAPLRVGPYDERLGHGVEAYPTPPAATKGSIYVITHVDVTPNFTADCIAMLKKVMEDTRKEPGFEQIEVWQQNARANHFSLTETWKDAASVEGHLIATSSREFREKLGPLSGALYDERHYKNLE
jgi:quinol monooxygenase YgiN